jgi:hypothetical protein
MLILNSLMPAFKNAPKKVKAKNQAKNSIDCTCTVYNYIVKHFAKSKKLFFCQYLSFSD